MSAVSIAFYSDAPSYGGAEASLATLLGALDPGLDAVVAGTDAAVVERLAAQRPDTPAHLVPVVSGKLDVAGLAGTARSIRSLNARIFQANLHAPAAGQYALASCRLLPSTRAVAVEHLPLPPDGALQLWLKRSTAKRLAAHVAVGDRVARQVEAFTGLESGSIRTIHNGVPDLELRPPPRITDAPTVGTIGRLDRQKGFDVLLRALVDVPDARLVIVGDGQERGALEELAAGSGLGGRVRFEGWREDARHLLPTFDVFALPSRFEGFPLSIIEAMLARRPVVATRVGSVEEAVGDRLTGLLVPPDDPGALAAALRELLGDSQLRSAMGSRGRERALTFTPAAMAAAYEQIYEEILR